MSAARLNLLTALVVFAAAVLWLSLGDVVSGLIWTAVSFFWLVWAFVSRNKEYEERPSRRIWRRVGHLLRWV